MSRSEPNWQSVVNEIAPSLYRYFAGSFPTALASDLVQETLIRLVQKHRNGDFDPSKGGVKNYAFGIARFVRLETLKDKKNIGLAGEDEIERLAADNSQIDRSDQAAHLRWAISQLKPIEQEIILLMIDSELLLEQIGTTLNIPVGTVKSHVHRAKEHLRQIMEAIT